MTLDRETIEIDGAKIRTGTAIYDTRFERVLWISEINDYELSVEVADAYEDDEPRWWSHDDDPTRVADGSRIAIDEFRSLLEDGRFELSPHDSESGTPR